MLKHVAYCDRCGEKVPDGLPRLKILVPSTLEHDGEAVEIIDLCPHCAIDRLQLEVVAKTPAQARDWVQAARYKVKNFDAKRETH